MRVQKKVATEWHQLVGAQTVEEVTPARWRMFADTDRDRLKIPFGHELRTGDIMYLDIKEGAEFGAGPHGMLIGTTGSGKSEFLRTLILSLAATHHPDQVNLLLTDFKGGSTFLGMEKLPHTAAVVTNMEEEAELVSRMGEVLTGELDRRQSILRQAGMQVGPRARCPVWRSTRSTANAAPTCRRCRHCSSSSTNSPNCCRTTRTSSRCSTASAGWAAHCGCICCWPPSR